MVRRRRRQPPAHDGEWLLEHGKGGEWWPAAGALLEGDAKRAIALIDAIPAARQNSGEALAAWAFVHYAAGDAPAVIAWYEAEIKTPDGAIEAVKYCACSPLPLVLALRDAGHPEFRPLLAAWRTYSDGMGEFFARAPLWNSDQGHIAALEGDIAAAKKHYGIAIDAGWRSPLFVSREHPAFLPADPAFDALLARMRDLINAERQALGMAPLAARARLR